MFDSLDKNKDGRLSKNEFINGLKMAVDMEKG